ncbi:retrovirus-related pol polyprotein from transposon TNT 1-94 [Tanacetum coccineum]
MEPKKVIQALEYPSWIEAMQEELLQFQLQKVWTLVNLPNSKRAIGTKWVFRNKKDERGIVVRNKERLVVQGFIMYQMDVKSAFLYGTIEEEVYVDDIIFGSTKKSLCAEFEGLMHKRFQMSSMGELTFFLALQVQQKKDGIFISQKKYVAGILKKFDFATVKTSSTPIESNKALIKDEEADSVDVHLYRSMIGSLTYLTASRPDIMFAVCACARFQVTPKMSHLHAVKRIFRYLKSYPKLGLWYPRDSPFDLEAFSDSNYAGASLDRKSIIGGCQFLGKRLILWQCKKHTIVANSTTEVEYVVAANCCGQVLWIQNQMLDYGFNFMNTKIYINNESTIYIVKNPVFHSKTKHIEIRHHFIRDCYEKKLIQVIKIHTDHNVTYLLTKAFDVSRHEENVSVHQIVDFLSTCSINYALIVSPTIYASYIEQFWNTTTSKTVNSVKQIHAIVDGKAVVISKLSVRSDLLFNDEVACLTNDEIFENLALLGYEQLSTKLTFQKVSHELQTEAHIEQILPSPSTYQRKQRKTQKHRRAKKVTELPQTSVPLDHGADEAVHKEGTRSERVLEKPNEPPILEGHTSGSGEGSMEHTFELMDTVPPTPHDYLSQDGLHLEVLDLEKEKDAQALEILKIKQRVKKLERKRKSSILHLRRRIYRQVESFDDDLDEEDASKKGREICKEKASNVFRKEREQYFEIQDLKAQLQDKNIAISELKKLIEKCKGKSVDTKFDKPSVVRQPNAQRIPKPSVLGKPAPFSDSLERTNFAKKKSVSKTNESEGLSKPVTPQNLPQTATQAVRNTNVIKPGMYRIASSTTQTRAPQLTQTSRNTNPRVSTSTGVAHRTNVSRPQPRSNQMKDKVLPNTSQVKFKKTEVEDHPRISSISNQTKSVTACNDSLNSRTSNVNAVCATCGKCVFNSNHDACVSKFLNDVNARTKKPNVVPISTRKPKSQANKSVATPHKKTVASESTTTNSKSYYRMLYKKTSKAWKWWIAQQCPSAYTWVPKTKRKWVPKVRNESVNKKVSFAIDNIVQLILFIVDSGCTKHMTGNLSLLCNFVEKYLGTVRFGNDQFAPILGYGDLVQGNITINRVYYVEGLNHNLFSVGQFCDADLEVAFRKSTCFVRDLQGNDLLTGNRGTDLYTISLQETTSSTPICLMAKASPTQAWLWHRRLSHLNFDYINLLSKKDVVIGLPKMKYVKDQLCSSCEVSKAKRSSFKSKTVPSSKGRLNLLHMDLCGPMRVASINGKRYILVIVDDYSRYTWTLFLRSKDETPEVLKDFLTMIQRNLQAPVISVRTDRGTEFLNKTLNAFFKEEGIEHQTSTPRTPEQNGVVERRNRTLVEAARTMLSASKLPLFFWAEAIATACYTQNRSIIIPTHEKMAYHIINDRKPSIKHLHIFGCTCYLTRDGENLDKMKEKGDPCILVGYSTQSKGYRVYNKRTRLIVESIHLRFDEIKEMSETSIANDTSGLIPQ